MNARVKLSSEGQIVLPKAIRDAHGWGEGTELELVDENGNVVLKPVETAKVEKRLSVNELLGSRIGGSCRVGRVENRAAGNRVGSAERVGCTCEANQ
jgi:AbrB family looped-hinge helix DNA binding protein